MNFSQFFGTDTISNFFFKNFRSLTFECLLGTGLFLSPGDTKISRANNCFHYPARVPDSSEMGWVLCLWSSLRLKEMVIQCGCGCQGMSYMWRKSSEKTWQFRNQPEKRGIGKGKGIPRKREEGHKNKHKRRKGKWRKAIAFCIHWFGGVVGR